jgi:RHS repeat-associated protein
MQTAGNLVQYDLSYYPAQAIYYSGTTGVPGSYLAMQSDGNLVIYTPSGSAFWSTGSVTGPGTYMLQVQDPGNLVIYRDIWETGTSQTANGITNFTSLPCSNIGNSISLNQNILTSSCLISSSGRFGLIMQTDGNLVLYDRSVNPASALWATATNVPIATMSVSSQVSLQTLYFYDALGNLLCVEQHGGVSGAGCSSSPSSDPTSPWRIRRFTYDSLSRLLTAHNPESGTITYAYDADGNVLQKTSPAPNQTGSTTQTISYCYDELHRMTGKAYSAQTCPLTSPVVTYSYDVGANAKGKLTSLTDQAGSASYAYDILGRMTSETRVISGVSKQFSYDYNLDGSLWKLHYPSGRIVTYTPDSAGRTVSASDSNGTTYVSAEFYANGAEFKRHQPVIFFQTTLNSRLQPAAVYSNNGQPGPAFINKTYIYGAPQQNNGNITSIVANEDASRTQTFTYDSLNRITSGYSAAATGAFSWGETYSIDPWGNLNIAPMANKAHGGTFGNASDNNNHALGFTYDAAGNLTNTSQYVYDPENRIQSTSGLIYTYDADGQRVMKANSSGAPTKRYWMSGGNILAEADGAGNLTAEYVFFGGKRLVRIDLPANTVHYYLSDHLGSTSKIINAAGVVEEESDFTAFGSELTAAQGTNHYKFTGKERDSESQLDYFGARYYSNLMGRLVTADPLMASARTSDPQTWNRYSYVHNNPLTFIDPMGLVEMSADQCSKDPNCVTVKVNVIYDKNANNGKGLTDEQKEKFGKGLQNAKDEYGDAKVHFEVGYTQGAVNTENHTVTGTVQGALNVVATDASSLPGSGASAITASGKALTFINVAGSDDGTLSHEMAHQFLGDTRGIMNSIARSDPSGMIGMVMNAVDDIVNDSARSNLGGRENTFGMGAGRDMRPANVMTRGQGFNEGAKEFQKAITPTQK